MFRLDYLKVVIDDLHQMQGLSIGLVLLIHSFAELLVVADVVVDLEWAQYHILDVQSTGQLGYSSLEAAEGVELGEIQGAEEAENSFERAVGGLDSNGEI